MLIYYHYVVYYFGYTLLSFTNLGNCQYTIKPQNTAVLKGRSAVLECKLQAVHQQGVGKLLWYSYVENEIGVKMSVDSKIVPEFVRQFTIVEDHGKFNLKLITATSTTAGKYGCINSLPPNNPPAYAIIVVLESEPEIFESIPRSLVLQNQQVRYTCQVAYATYSNKLTPKLTWKGLLRGDITHTDESEDNLAKISIQVTGEVANNGEIFSCVTSFEESDWPSGDNYARNNPTYNHIANTTGLIVHYGPQNTAIHFMNDTVIQHNAIVNVEGYIKCTSESNPNVSLYQWITTRDNKIVGKGSILQLQKEWRGLIEIRCNATNYVGHNNMSKTDFVEIYLNVIGLTQGEVAGIGVAVVVSVAIVAAIVLVIIYRCQMGKTRHQGQNGDKKNESMLNAKIEKHEKVQIFKTPSKDKCAVFRQISEHIENPDGSTKHTREYKVELRGFDRKEFPSHMSMIDPDRMVNNRPHLQLQEVED